MNKLKLSSNGVSKYFLADHLGSTTALTDSSGNILDSTTYDSFGNAANQLSTRYAYTGREFDSFTGLHYYRARFYDAQLGRFISEDPIGFAGGDVNLFGYVKNNSVNKKDPFGLFDAGTAIKIASDVARVPGLGPVLLVAGGGFAIGYAIGYYPGQWTARYFFPDQFPDTQTQPQPEACTTKPKPSPQPAPTPPPVSTSPTYPREQPPDDKRRCGGKATNAGNKPVTTGKGELLCTYYCIGGTSITLNNGIRYSNGITQCPVLSPK